MDNFTIIRNGLYGHIKAGRMSPFDLGVYVFLHLRVSWTTGTYQGCALTIACDFGDPKLKENIQKSLRRLRDRGYINYPKGDGSRGSYQILINKYEPTAGELLGTRLNAWKNGDLCQPEYEPQNCDRTVGERKRRGSGTVVAPFQDLKTLQDDEQDGTTAAPRLAERRGTRIPLDFIVTKEHREWARKNSLPDPDSLIDDFRDYWQAKVGKDSLKLDWDATFRRWIRNSVTMNRKSNENRHANRNRAEQRKQSNLAAGERALEILERRLAN